jgi:hypothetical protein
MTKLEFRFWDKANRRYYDVVESVPLVNHFGNVTLDGGMTFDNDFIVEEYTGKRDKNGKKIFVGDLVEMSDTR